MKKILGALCAFVVSALAFGATLGWDANPSEDGVLRYVLEHRISQDAEWTQVIVEAPANRVVVPESAYGRWFRMAAVNSFGQGEWSDPVKLPEKVKGLWLILEITP
jgi:hypothetical protein